MNIGGTLKSWWGYAAKNKYVARGMANGTFESVGRFSAVGASIGGVQGAARRVAGDADASVTGGMVSGAAFGASIRGMGYGFKKVFKRGRSGPGPSINPRGRPGFNAGSGI